MLYSHVANRTATDCTLTSIGLSTVAFRGRPPRRSWMPWRGGRSSYLPAPMSGCGTSTQLVPLPTLGRVASTKVPPACSRPSLVIRAPVYAVQCICSLCAVSVVCQLIHTTTSDDDSWKTWQADLWRYTRWIPEACDVFHHNTWAAVRLCASTPVSCRWCMFDERVHVYV